MGGNFVRWLGLGMALGMAFQPALAGERKEATTHRGAAAAASARHSDFAGSIRSSGNNHAAAAFTQAQGRGELAFFQVTPFESRSGEKASRQREEQKGSGPTTPRERKTVTLLRFNPNVAVQPI